MKGSCLSFIAIAIVLALGTAFIVSVINPQLRQAAVIGFMIVVLFASLAGGFVEAMNPPKQ